MDLPQELSIAEIRYYMLKNECKVTNHALVKHFRKFLTNPDTQSESRKRFKTYVTLLSTIKNENNQKFLILRKKYINEGPTAEAVERAVEAAGNAPEPGSPGGGSINFDTGMASPLRQPPPYKPPPEVTSSPSTGVEVHQEHKENYRDCVNEFAAVMQRIDPARLERQPDDVDSNNEPANAKSMSRANSVDESNNKENINIPRFSFSSGASTDSSTTDKVETDVAENPISVKEATRKFNRMASEEEAKIISPPAKKKPEKQLIEEKDSPEVTLAHPKAKEWIVSMARANYQELAKLASEFPELVKLQDPSTGYTALHWAAKHGNEDVVKLIAGTYKADVNARTNGGYTPLHLATQFGRDNIFELLWNVYKANRDIMDWSGNKPLDYSRQRPSVSASTCSSEYQKYFYNTEVNNNYQLGPQYSELIFPSGGFDIGGGTLSSALTRGKKRSQMRNATVSGGTGGGLVGRSQSLMIRQSQRRYKKPSVQSLFMKPNAEEDDLVPCEIVTQPDKSGSEMSTEIEARPVRGGATTQRKESFLRKTFRSAAGGNRLTKDVVTNPTQQS